MQPIDHSQPDHDDTLVARLAADDLHGSEAAAARTLVAACPACATLLGDLRAIIHATATLPAPRRPRDFRLTEADAARLRPAGWRAILRAFGQPRMAVAGPLATGLAALGIGGILVASLAGGMTGAATGAAGALPFGAAERAAVPSGPAYAPAPEQQSKSNAAPSAAASASTDQAAPAAGSSPSAAPDGASRPSPSLAASLNPISGFAAPSGGAAPSSGPGTLTSRLAPTAPAGSAVPSDLRLFATTESPPSSPSSGPSPLIVGSVLFLLVGLGLGALRLVGRRLA